MAALRACSLEESRLLANDVLVDSEALLIFPNKDRDSMSVIMTVRC
jgi:hypothetical protein